MSNRRALLIPVLVALLVATWLAGGRLGLERSYRDVEVSVDYAEVSAVAAFSGQSVPAVLARLRGLGLVSVALEEPLLRDLVNGGALTLTGGPHTAAQAGSVEAAATAGSAAGLAAVTALARRYGGTRMGPTVRLGVPGLALLDAGGGIDPQAIAQVREAGLVPIARLRNSPGLTDAAIDTMLADLAAQGVRRIVFAGDQVLGFRELRDSTAASLARYDLAWGRVEFAEQKGEDKLADTILRGQPGVRPRGYIRLHGVTAGEMAKLAPEVIIERYRRAAQERNIRLVFVRLLLTPSHDALAANEAYLGRIVSGLRESGMKTGQTTAFPLVSPGRWRPMVISLLGIASVAAWLLAQIGGDWSPRRWLGWWLGLGALALLLALARPQLHNKLMALLCGMVYPLWAGRRAWLALVEDRVKSPAQAVALLWTTIGITVAGGLMASGLLASTSYYLHHDAFAGVKLAHLVPLLGMALVVAGGFSLPGADARAVRRKLADLLANPVTAGYLLTALVVGVVLLLMLVRSGNDGLEVSSTELRFRSILERIFIARPRTKEFLVGDPALLLAALAVVRGRRQWSGLLLLVGMIGVVGTFNTFCHLHTPLTQSLLRTFHALWLGTLLGLGAAALLWRRGANEEST
ncbi:MAG: hypothetical protein HZB16_17865 [Armatimonadetes bacterium]|nr:hypothetical protein [Armatimonadota bacterium]